MINPVREIYEMEFRQRDLERELDNHRRVQLALGERAGYLARLFAKLRQLGKRKRHVNRQVAVDLHRPRLDSLH